MSARTFHHISVPFVNNLAKEILNSLVEVTNKHTGKAEFDTSLYNRKKLDFRAIIDNTFPTILIVDYKDIEKELQKYTDITASISTEISETAKVPSKSLEHLSTKQIVNIVSAVRSGISRLASATPITEVGLANTLSKIFASPSINQGTALIEFKKVYPSTYKITTNSNTREFYLFPNFAQVSGQINKFINLAIEGISDMEGVKAVGIETIGAALAYGHTAVGTSTDIFINTPKIVAIILDSISNTSNKHADDINVLDMFLTNTTQVDIFIDITKDFSNTQAISQFIQLGGNLVKYENTVINSLRGTHQEKTGNVATNKKVLSHLSKLFEQMTDSYSNTIRRAINKFVVSRDSPSMLDYITINILDAIEGNPTNKYKLTKLLTKNSNSKNSLISKNTKSIRPKVSIKNKIPHIRTTSGQFYSLTSLQALINAHLQDVISANMGNGSDTRILNYRTGRFAASAQVERMSQSREGAITAFYSYMKNPYATFEPTGKQGSPKTRDPRLLIAGSIREIAATKVGNKLRSVSI